MFLATASSPSFGYPKPLKDSSNVPQSYFGGLGSDGTTPISSESPQYGGNNQRSGGANQPQEGGFAGLSKGDCLKKLNLQICNLQGGWLFVLISQLP